ncbi:LysR family transcriptional regulator [Kineosporia mesophila]|uniref:LysR family transcriptional regulator n=1 Tax=Kineosporia mesophila TaxID=566012 RepID=A0ABP6YY98_9ACTN|nr:LysR family transcriptional regulator [Kineosporia mesophila]MCD5354269.1 LysR substrate-binding domain-containing protein [Kineosporia mesophila]
MLDSYRLRLLVAVADTGSIAGAAAALGCSPAAASQQLAVLEREAEAQLLERSARSVRLSSAGRILVDHARPIVAGLDRAGRAVAAAGTVDGGRIRVASFATASRRLVAPAMASLRRRHPQLDQTFTELEPEDAVPAVREGRVDLAVTHQYAGFPAPDARGLHPEHLLTDPLSLVVPVSDPHAGDGQVRLEDFAAAGWISGRSTQGFQAMTEMAARLAGFEPRITSRADSYGVVLNLVGAGLGVALVPRSTFVARPGIVLLNVTTPARLARTVHVVTRDSDHSPAVRALRDALIKKAATLR